MLCPLVGSKFQITSLYGGPLEFIFVVESTEDPAYRAVSLLITQFKVRFQLFCLLAITLVCSFII